MRTSLYTYYEADRDRDGIVIHLRRGHKSRNRAGGVAVERNGKQINKANEQSRAGEMSDEWGGQHKRE